MSGSAIVVGAGVFGASVARHLAGDGWTVTLVEQAEPAHPKATSGADTRVLRYGHGDAAWYMRLAWRAHALWRELEQETGAELLAERGVLWLGGEGNEFLAQSEGHLRAEGIPVERLDLADAAALYPSFDANDLGVALLEPAGGVLLARKAVQALVDSARARGATWRQGRAVPHGAGVRLDGEVLTADRVVWACGPWLPKLFGGLVQMRVARVEDRYLDAGPAWAGVPVWMDYDVGFYGLPDVGWGVKAAQDQPEEDYDPDTGSRALDPAEEQRIRKKLANRFPALADAPTTGGKVCQYELTVDNEFIIAPHPEHDGVWILGGGSGHGFKHGPALGEYVASLLDGRAAPEPRFGLQERTPARGLRTRANDFPTLGR
jgi:sarcosine oxidase